ncbi:MAG TPA: energy transducer TonB [Candidatus Sulfotelmatobacter sp.]|nr:energy transducer TonB [Candidatus Sulfotelmatobacter sp.]
MNRPLIHAALHSRFKLRTYFLAACLICLHATSSAQEVQARAEAMLVHARQLSDIRSPGAPAFRLQATFSFLGDNLEPVQGTYTETWFSDLQWRRETVIGDSRHIEIAGSTKYWRVYPDGFPAQAIRLPALMTFLPPASLQLSFASISEHATPSVIAECAYSRPVAQNQSFVFCFEKKSGVLLEKTLPEKRPRNVVSFSCEYGSFRKFGNYEFPHEVVCLEDRHKTISADIVDLSIEPPMDPALFTPPADAIELDRCFGKTVRPTLSDFDLMIPDVDLDRVAWITVWFVVDTKGRPQDLRILRSISKGSHEKALDKVRNSRFNPGTCDGKPIAMVTSLEIPSTPK